MINNAVTCREGTSNEEVCVAYHAKILSDFSDFDGCREHLRERAAVELSELDLTVVGRAEDGVVCL